MVKINPAHIRIFFILFLPLILSIVVLFNPTETFPLINEENENGKLLTRVSEDVINPPSFKNAIRNIFQVPFDLKWYNICFVNKDSKINYKNVNYTLNTTVKLNNDTLIQVPSGEKRCKLYKLNEEFVLEWLFVVPPDDHDDVYLSVSAYAKPEGWGLVTKIFLFNITWFGLALGVTEIYKLIKFGVKK